MPQQSGLQSRKQMHTLLTQGRQVAADAAEDSGSCLTAEGARHLLLDAGPCVHPVPPGCCQKAQRGDARRPAPPPVHSSSGEARCALHSVWRLPWCREETERWGSSHPRLPPEPYTLLASSPSPAHIRNRSPHSRSWLISSGPSCEGTHHQRHRTLSFSQNGPLHPV